MSHHLTDIQEWVLRRVNGGTTVTRKLNEALYDSSLSRYASGGRRWDSRGEAANPHIAALVKKELLHRPKRGAVALTVKGEDWLRSNPVVTRAK